MALSPDGKYLAYSDNPGGRQSLWVRQLDGGNPLELIAPRNAGYWGVAFARDGASIFYAIKSRDDPDGSIYQIPFLGGPSRKIVAGVDSPPALSPDGKQLAYLRADFPERGASALMIAGIDGTNPRALAVRRAPEFFAPGFFVSASWAPDGSRLVTSVRNTQARRTTLVTVGLTGDEAPLGEAFTEIGSTNWLPDGVVFIARGLGGLATGGGGQIWMQPYPGGAPHRLTNDLIDYRSSSTTADGKSILSVGLDANPLLWTIPLDGKGEPRKLPSMRYDGTFGVSWGVDGQIMFTSPVRGALQIWAMNLDGSNRRALTTEGTNAWPSAVSRWPLRGVLRPSWRAARGLADESGWLRPTSGHGRHQRLLPRHDARLAVDHVHDRRGWCPLVVARRESRRDAGAPDRSARSWVALPGRRSRIRRLRADASLRGRRAPTRRWRAHVDSQ